MCDLELDGRREWPFQLPICACCTHGVIPRCLQICPRLWHTMSCGSCAHTVLGTKPMDKFPTSWKLLRAVLSVYVSVATFCFRKSLKTKQWNFREELLGSGNSCKGVYPDHPVCSSGLMPSMSSKSQTAKSSCQDPLFCCPLNVGYHVSAMPSSS